MKILALQLTGSLDRAASKITHRIDLVPSDAPSASALHSRVASLRLDLRSSHRLSWPHGGAKTSRCCDAMPGACCAGDWPCQGRTDPKIVSSEIFVPGLEGERRK
jgi:hypothetical protein